MTAVHPPVRSGPLIRVLPTPRTEPPYDDECDAPPALPGQLRLPWAPAAPRPRTDLSGTGAAGAADAGVGTAGVGTADVGAADVGTADVGAADVGAADVGAAGARLAAWRFAARYAEILDERRPVGHLGPVACPAALAQLMADALHARAHLRDLAAARRPGGGRAGRRPAGRPAATVTAGRPLVSRPCAGVLDAVVVLRLRSGAARSLAFRLRYDAGAWRASEATLVGATPPRDAATSP
ncbi:hypothetical protein GCM10010124_05260 [Pilimelia terevasa]|uniref:Uncharacterized protein n=1 Tax=Pilimelia terevasa TaxID=53372 RepID=A0A8J3BHN2_9ACTN|nr:Rv3235 family protein [Pilimelia terevasa]GGK15469.1 hypothetical protein GCM10010124_05260 [Pilimelia terevasa]